MNEYRYAMYRELGIEPSYDDVMCVPRYQWSVIPVPKLVDFWAKLFQQGTFP